ncbi:hypothetical protein ACVWDB_26530, partial [Escherichia coli]
MIPVWSTACPDWAERLKKGLSIIPDPIYPDEAAHALAIFKQLRIVDAPGSPTFGESCAPWVFDLVAALFGSYDAQTGVRHIKEVFILIPKKNGTVAKLAMRQPFVLFKGLTFQKLCLPGAFRPGDHHNKMLRPG